MPAGARESMEKRLRERLGGEELGPGATFDAKFKRKDGTEVHLEHTVTSWDAGDKRHFGAIMRAITKWVMAKAALALSEVRSNGRANMTGTSCISATRRLLSSVSFGSKMEIS